MRGKSLIFKERVWVKIFGVLKNYVIVPIVFATLTGVLAQVRIPLFFTPVPVTLQVFAIIFYSLYLSPLCALIATLYYVFLGYAGIPWFSGFKSFVFSSPTAGYILGFILSSYFISRYKKTYWSIVGGVVLIYFTGTLYLKFYLGVSFLKAVQLGVLPFIIFDFVKGAFAYFIYKRWKNLKFF